MVIGPVVFSGNFEGMKLSFYHTSKSRQYSCVATENDQTVVLIMQLYAMHVTQRCSQSYIYVRVCYAAFGLKLLH